jgi:hypothetical protein
MYCMSLGEKDNEKSMENSSDYHYMVLRVSVERGRWRKGGGYLSPTTVSTVTYICRFSSSSSYMMCVQVGSLEMLIIAVLSSIIVLLLIIMAILIR